MTRGLEARVAKLEQATSASDRIVVVHSYESGELYGYVCQIYGREPIEVIRIAGESDEELRKRAADLAEISGLALNGIIPLSELRR